MIASIETRTVTARLLLAIFDSLYLLALAALVGSNLFVSFIATPILLSVLGEKSGGQVVRSLSPRYYAWGVACCAITLPSLVCSSLIFPELRGPMVGVQAGLIAANLVILLFCGNTLTPLINQAHEEGPGSAGRYNRLCRDSFRLNALVLVFGVLLLIAFASRKGLRTDGIEEPSPTGRANQADSQPGRP